MTADDQQERLDAQWVTGFVDGEGCFHVSINKVREMSIGWQVLPEFRVVQHERDLSVLEELRRFFNAGKVVVNHGTRKELRIRKLSELKEIVSFFKRYPLKTKKEKDLEIFEQILVREEVEKKFNPEILRQLTEDQFIDFERFRRYCWYVNDEYILSHEGYELYAPIMDCYRRWKSDGK